MNMKKTGRFIFTAAFPLLIAVMFQKTVYATPMELLENPGFEDVIDAAMIPGWSVDKSGIITSSADAHTGQRALKFEKTGEREVRLYGRIRYGTDGTATSVKPGAIYHLSVWVRGTGYVKLEATEYSGANFLKTDFLRDHPGVNLTGQWQKLTAEYRPTDRRLQRAAFAVMLSGKGAVAYLDDASFSFDPDENPTVNLETAAPEHKVVLNISSRDADVEVFMNGVPVNVKGNQCTVIMKEGMTTAGLRALAKGKNPGIQIKISGHPETDGRWLSSSVCEEKWKETVFDDRRWTTVTVDNDGYMWHQEETAVPETGKDDVYFRQILLWNDKHYGPDRCVLPKTREWGFSQGSMDTLTLALYSPFPYSLPDYEFILDLPQGFELFGKMGDYWLRYVLNRRPVRIDEEEIVRDGMTYTRYHIFHHERELDPQKAPYTQYSLLPVRLNGNFKGAYAAFYYRRQAKVNFTELEQKIPVTILPPINGRQPKKILISQFSPLFQAGYDTFSPEYLKAMVKQSAEMGFNFSQLTVSEWEETQPAWGKKWNDFLRSFYRELRKNNIRTFVIPPYDLPVAGSSIGGFLKEDKLACWVKATPDAQARYFKDTRKWDMRNNNYCLDYVRHEGKDRFLELLKELYEDVIADTPEAEALFLDYEIHPWGWSGKGDGSYCFCDRCKESFRKFAGIPADVELTDDTIFNSYQSKWEDFHLWQVTEIQENIRNTANKAGLRYMIYSWESYRSFWSRMKNKADICFVGCPGNSPADSYFQRYLDVSSKYFREELDMPQVMGQRFSFLNTGTDKDGWKKLVVLSHDGFVNAMSWKSQVLRVVAAYGGGIDLQNSRECVAGMQYWIGEATRIIAAHEDIFLHGKREDALANSEQIAYPDLLVIRNGDERLLLLFNEEAKPLKATISNLGLKQGQEARIFESSGSFADASLLTVSIPAKDAVVIHIK